MDIVGYCENLLRARGITNDLVLPVIRNLCLISIIFALAGFCLWSYHKVLLGLATGFAMLTYSSASLSLFFEKHPPGTSGGLFGRLLAKFGLHLAILGMAVAVAIAKLKLSAVAIIAGLVFGLGVMAVTFILTMKAKERQ